MAFADLLKAILGRKKKATVPLSGPQPARSPLDINLGIDFGTSFTKVCFRDLGAESSGIVRFRTGGGDADIIPSLVLISPDGALRMGHHQTPGSDAVPVRYLKMRIAGVSIEQDEPVSATLDTECPTTCSALAAWFLASVIREARESLARAEADRFKNRDVAWSANVGVPVEHYDSPVLAGFEKVLRVAWSWAASETIPSLLREVVELYRRDEPALETAVADFHAVPEIAAAVHSFVCSREAIPDFYVYFDIGGGTVDGVAFKYDADGGVRQVDFYSGRVAPIGMAVRDRSASPNELRKDVQRLVAQVVITAKRKDGRDWQRDAIQGQQRQRPTLRKLDEKDMAPLIFFLGGYGADDAWYSSAIEATYADFDHRNAGVPPYQLRRVPRPKDLDIGGLTDAEFIRFAVAYGLSIPHGEGPEVKLPSYFAEPEAPTVRSPAAVAYADHKDVYG